MQLCWLCMPSRLPAALVSRLRREVHSALSALPPSQARALRARFALDTAADKVDDEESLLKLAQELTRLNRLEKKSRP